MTEQQEPLFDVDDAPEGYEPPPRWIREPVLVYAWVDGIALVKPVRSTPDLSTWQG